MSRHSARLFSEQAWHCIARQLELSPREVEIAQRIVQDHKELRIALDLSISPHTVHTHLERLYRKLDVSSRLELAMRLAQCQMDLIESGSGELEPVCPNRRAGLCPLQG